MVADPKLAEWWGCSCGVNSATPPSLFLSRTLYCTLDLFLLPTPTPEIRMEAGWPLKPASPAYWCVTSDIGAPVSHSTVHSSPLMSGIHCIISWTLSWLPSLPPHAVASIRHPCPFPVCCYKPVGGLGWLPAWGMAWRGVIVPNWRTQSLLAFVSHDPCSW
jgi:hypothetical protein